MKENSKGLMWRYVLYTYLLFWFFVLGVCGVAVFVFEASDQTMRWLVSLCSWTPTMVLFLMRKKLFKEHGIKQFYANLLKNKISLVAMITSMLLIIAIFLASTLLLSIRSNVEFTSLLTFAPSLLIGNIFFTLIQGATGEESGWRGYLLPKMEDTFGFLKGNLILGFIWAGWHLPLWFVSGTYGGLDLVLYIIFFVIGLVSFSMIMAIYMRKSKNLILAVWMHFWFNFILTFFMGKDIELLGAYAILYAITALIMFKLYIKKVHA